VLGSILGVLFIRLLFEGMNDLAPVLANIIPSVVPIGPIVRVTFGLTIILFLIIAPRGSTPGWQITEVYYRLFLFHIKDG
jgi:ABC-type branched-subunit amino acid transport system permease subunit